VYELVRTDIVNKRGVSNALNLYQSRATRYHRTLEVDKVIFIGGIYATFLRDGNLQLLHSQQRHDFRELTCVRQQAILTLDEPMPLYQSA
jgi:hypothetical protein